MARKKSTEKLVRIYYSKKKGEYVKKEYDRDLYKYNKKDKAPSLFYKSGMRKGQLRKNREKAIDKMVDFVYKKLKGTKYDNDGMTTREEIELSVRQMIKRAEDEKIKMKSITAERVIASYTRNKLSGMLINTGQTLDEIADKLDVSVEELLDDKNWNFETKNPTFKLPEWNEPKEFEWTDYYVGDSSLVTR